LAIKFANTMKTIVRNAVSSDFCYIESLRRKNGSALGFIPKNVYIIILEKNGLRKDMKMVTFPSTIVKIGKQVIDEECNIVW
tara:strand:- start:9392 stop:9637 length:246 start_codon:yes stop_codon:yes gene_type:complete